MPWKQLDGFGNDSADPTLLYSARRFSTIPARRGESLAGHPGGGVGGQKHGDAGDIVGLAEPAERGARHHVFLEIAADDAGGVGALGLHAADRSLSEEADYGVPADI